MIDALERSPAVRRIVGIFVAACALALLIHAIRWW